MWEAILLVGSAIFMFVAWMVFTVIIPFTCIGFIGLYFYRKFLKVKTGNE